MTARTWIRSQSVPICHLLIHDFRPAMSPAIAVPRASAVGSRTPVADRVRTASHSKGQRRELPGPGVSAAGNDPLQAQLEAIPNRITQEGIALTVRAG